MKSTHSQFGEDVGSSSNTNANHTLHPDETHTNTNQGELTNCLFLQKYPSYITKKTADSLKLCQNRRQHLSQLIHGGVLVPAHTRTQYEYCLKTEKRD